MVMGGLLFRSLLVWVYCYTTFCMNGCVLFSDLLRVLLLLWCWGVRLTWFDFVRFAF